MTNVIHVTTSSETGARDAILMDMPTSFACGRCGDSISAPSDLNPDELGRYLLAHIRECRPAKKELERHAAVTRRSCAVGDTPPEKRNL